jgi:hypothetical protein
MDNPGINIIKVIKSVIYMVPKLQTICSLDENVKNKFLTEQMQHL